MIILIAWPAWVWKDSVLNKLQMERRELNLQKVITTTTRPKREYEIPWVHYNFLEKEQFESLIVKDELIEYAKVHWNYYGSRFLDLDNTLKLSSNVAYIVDVQWVATFTSKLKPKYDVCSFFISPPSKQQLVDRLVNRNTETPETLATRLQTMEFELSKAWDFDYQIINDDLDEAVWNMYNIITRLN